MESIRFGNVLLFLGYRNLGCRRRVLWCKFVAEFLCDASYGVEDGLLNTIF